MTESKSFKRRVRERMSKTGESYTAARTHVAEKRDRTKAAGERLADTSGDRISEAKLVEATGKGWDEWFGILDRWGATDHPHIEIARYLADEQGAPMWWTQSITVEYERARDAREVPAARRRVRGVVVEDDRRTRRRGVRGGRR
jgi:hypothetical protein